MIHHVAGICTLRQAYINEAFNILWSKLTYSSTFLRLLCTIMLSMGTGICLVPEVQKLQEFTLTVLISDELVLGIDWMAPEETLVIAFPRERVHGADWTAWRSRPETVGKNIRW